MAEAIEDELLTSSQSTLFCMSGGSGSVVVPVMVAMMWMEPSMRPSREEVGAPCLSSRCSHSWWVSSLSSTLRSTEARPSLMPSFSPPLTTDSSTKSSLPSYQGREKPCFHCGLKDEMVEVVRVRPPSWTLQ